MNCLPPVLYLALLLDSALTSLPAPVNISVTSVNFHHVLRWDPGPGTPPGTRYKIIRRVNGKEPKKLPYSMTTSFKLKLPRHYVEYVMTVQASYNQTLSPESKKVHFTPFTQTKLGPPKVSLAGCGNCIKINMSLPEADQTSGIDDIQTIYPGAQFRIFWRKHKEAVESDITPNKSYTINNLQTGTEYCVQVHTKINVNRNTEPSAWNCTFTSFGPNRDPYVSGKLAALLIVIFGVLMSSMFCLHYTGYLCKLATLPRVLIEALSQGYTLTPERIIPDHICINAEMEKHNNPTAPLPATRRANSEEEDEEEEEGDNIYMDRGAELTSGENSCQDSVDVSKNSKAAASEGSGSLTVEVKVPDTEFEGEVRQGGLDSEEDNSGRAEGSFRPEGLVTGEVKEEDEEEEVCESSGNINLFSVTLAALAVCEEVGEEEEQNVRDSLTDLKMSQKMSDLELLLPSDSRRTSDDSDDQTVMLPTQEDFTASGYEDRRANALSGCLKTCDSETQHEETQEEEEEEEEEGFSGYMRHT